MMRAIFLDAATLIPHTNLEELPQKLDESNFDIDLQALKQTIDQLTLLPLFTGTDEEIKQLREADVIITNKVRVDENLLNHAKKVRLVCVAATGINNVDLPYLEKENIALTNVAGYSTPSVVQTVFQLLLSLVNRWDSLQADLTSRPWSSHHQFSFLPFGFSELAGKTLGIIGYGTIGKAVAKVAEAFGMNVVIAALPGRPVTEGRLVLDEFLSQCDVVSLHCPQVKETEKLVDQAFLSKMKSSAVLVNTARGGLIDEAALASALENRTIAGAGLDVLSTEPPARENPLLGTPNCLISPHIGWASKESRQRLVNEIAANIVAYKQQKNRNRIV